MVLRPSGPVAGPRPARACAGGQPYRTTAASLLFSASAARRAMVPGGARLPPVSWPQARRGAAAGGRDRDRTTESPSLRVPAAPAQAQPHQSIDKCKSVRNRAGVDSDPQSVEELFKLSQ